MNPVVPNLTEILTGGAVLWLGGVFTAGIVSLYLVRNSRRRQ